jgi:hypothetical protein
LLWTSWAETYSPTRAGVLRKNESPRGIPFGNLVAFRSPDQCHCSVPGVPDLASITPSPPQCCPAAESHKLGNLLYCVTVPSGMGAASVMALGCLLCLLVGGQLATAARQPQDSSMTVDRRHKHKHPYSAPAGWFIQVSVRCGHTFGTHQAHLA